MTKTITVNVKLDIHPDGDIYLWDGKKFVYLGWLTNEEFDSREAYKLLTDKKNEHKQTI